MEQGWSALAGANELAVEVRVDAAVSEQVDVLASLNDLALMEYEYEIGVPDRAETVGNDETGSVLQQELQGPLDANLGHRIDAAGGFVQDQDTGIGEHGAGEADQLSLPQ